MTRIQVRRAVFLDRDGVINVDSAYVGQPQDFIFEEGAKAALARLHAAGYLLIVVTNQSGIARGFYSAADFDAVTAYMCAELAEANAPIARVEHCPHLPESMQSPGNMCTCRKPKPGMILSAAAALGIDVASSIMIGDKRDDIFAGRAAAVGRCYLVGAGADLEEPRADGAFANLAQCVEALLGFQELKRGPSL
jgi:D-glycero-D-manno-heptose 1,7-bisphosphate phosphatase